MPSEERTVPREMAGSDAPCEMSSDEAFAWAQGYNSAVEKLATSMLAPIPVSAETMAALEAMQTLHMYSSHPAALYGPVFDAHIARCVVSEGAP